MDQMTIDLGRLDGTPGGYLAFLSKYEDESLSAFFSKTLLLVGADGTTFYGTFGTTTREFIEGLTACYFAMADRRETANARESQLRGYIAMTALTVELIVDADIGGRGQLGLPPREDAPSASLRETMFADPAVREVLFALYAPSRQHDASVTDEENKRALEQWTYLQHAGGSVTFHRRGTTSFILRLDIVHLGRSESLALKCLIYPYIDVAPISESTAIYYRYRIPNPTYMPMIRSASDKWIVMDFVDGISLAELGPGLALQEDGDVHLPTYKTMISMLLRALHELDSARLPTGRSKVTTGHWDLAPSNIIAVVKKGHSPEDLRRIPASAAAGITDPPKFDAGMIEKLVLVDMGPNHLYSRALGLLEGPESVFVAPEIKDERSESESSDLFSFGMLVVWLTEKRIPSGASVPDRLYQRVLPLARLVEDLIDERPGRRLRIFPFLVMGPGRYDRLRQAVTADLDVLEAADRLTPADEKWIRAIVDLYKLREPRRQFRLFRAGQRRRGAESIIDDTGWLLFWSAMCSLNWYLTTGVIFLWALRDVGIENFPLPVEVVTKLSGQDGLPGIDALRVGSYELGLHAVNIQALVLAFSFTLVATKYYQSIYSRLRVQPARGLLAHATEFAMRFNSCWVGGPILVAILVNPLWWPWCAAIGYFGTTSNDFFSHRLAERSLRKGLAEFSSIPPHSVDSLRSYGEWWRIMFVYAVILSFLAYGLTIGSVRDWSVYAGLIALVNLAKLYPSNCSRLAPTVRGTLSRCLVLNERLNAVRSGRASSETAGEAAGDRRSLVVPSVR